MNEEDLKNRIKSETDNIEIPDSLNPEEIKKMLYKHKNKKRNNIYRYIFIAASIVLIVTISTMFLNNKDNNNQVADIEEVKSYSNIETVKSYLQLYSALNKVHKENVGSRNYMDEEFVTQDSVSTNESTMKESFTDYSSTNVQVEGIDEGDIVKTDGKYIYSLLYNKLSIVETNNGNMNVVSEMKVDEIENSEIYIYNDLLIILGDYYLQEASDNKVYDDIMVNNEGKTKVLIYNIKDKKEPKLINTIVQDGSYSNSRLTDNYLYLFSNYYVSNYEGINEKEYYVPSVNGTVLECNDIYMPTEVNNEGYMVMSSIDLNKPNEIYDKKAVVASSDVFYVSENNIYVSNSNYMSNKSEILKFNYNKGKIQPVGKASIEGYLNDQFSMDENNGYLRLVTTINNNNNIIYRYLEEYTNTEVDNISNSLLILDENLNLVGKIENLAPNERIYSARFLGDKGYFVTFRRIDPLFSVDLSDPTNPKVLGELKIPGFSSYLHPFSEDLLLGIGEEIDENTNESIGIKLSMFDISDPTNVKEVNKLVLDEYYYTEALYNHKSVLINTKDKNIIGFGANYQTEDYNSYSDYLLFSYNNEKGFINLLEYKFEGEVIRSRGVYIGDILYLIKGNYEEDKIGLTSISLKDYRVIEKIN